MRLIAFSILLLGNIQEANAQSFLPKEWMASCFAHFNASNDPTASHYYATRCATYPAEMCAFVKDPEQCYQSFSDGLSREANRLLELLPKSVEGTGVIVDGLNETLSRARNERYDGLCEAVAKNTFDSEAMHMPNSISYEGYCTLTKHAHRVNDLRYVYGQLSLIKEGE